MASPGTVSFLLIPVNLLQFGEGATMNSQWMNR